MRRRRTLTPGERKQVLRAAGRRCHICGGPAGEKWEADHVRSVARGGSDQLNNYLPACRTCNGLKWHRKSLEMRQLLRWGLLMKQQMRRGTALGKELRALVLSDKRKKLLKKRANPALQPTGSARG